MNVPPRVRQWAMLALVVALVLGLSACHPESTPPTTGPQLTLRPDDRLLILAPHPDDEVLCCAGLIQRAIAMGIPVRTVFFTYGDNNQWSFALYRKHPVLLPWAIRQMGLVRHDEAVAAAKTLGLSPTQLTFLGYPDFGTLKIWNDHWQKSPPFRSMLSRATQVPYTNALRPGAAYKGEEVLRDLTAVLREVKPTKVFVSHPADYMPDHLALYLFTRVALWDLASELQPELYPYLIHFQRWPQPRGYRPETWLEPPTALKDAAIWRSYQLTTRQLEQKRAAIRTHRSQYAYSAKYLLSFVRPNELFGNFPMVQLGGGSPPIRLASDGDTHELETPEELTQTERAAFVGLETRSVQLDGDQLVLSIGFSRPLAQAVQASIYVFGYRADRPFAQMPKLHFKLGAVTYALYDQHRRLSTEGIQINRQLKQLTIRLPLHLLGDPDRILTSARTSFGEVPLDWASWRIVDLPRGNRMPRRDAPNS